MTGLESLQLVHEKPEPKVVSEVIATTETPVKLEMPGNMEYVLQKTTGNGTSPEERPCVIQPTGL